jgi:hypothetical protein
VDRCQGKRARRSTVRSLAEVRAPVNVQTRRCKFSGNYPGVNPWLMLTIRKYCLPAILDSGSSFSFLRRDVFQRVLGLGLSCSSETTNREVRMAFGQSCVIKELISLQVKIHSFS